MGPVGIEPKWLNLKYIKGSDEEAGTLDGSLKGQFTIGDATIEAKIDLNRQLQFIDKEGKITPAYYENFSTKLNFNKDVNLGGITIDKSSDLNLQYVESPKDGKIDKIWGLTGQARFEGLGPVDKLNFNLGDETGTNNNPTKKEVDKWIEGLKLSTKPQTWNLGKVKGGLEEEIQLGPLSMSGLSAKVNNENTKDLPWGLLYYQPATPSTTSTSAKGTTKLTVTAEDVNLDIGILADAFKYGSDGLTVFADKLEPAVNFLTQEVNLADQAPEALKGPLVEFLESTPGNKPNGKIELIELFDIANASYQVFKGTSFDKIKSITPGIRKAKEFIKQIRELSGYAQNVSKTGMIELGNIPYTLTIGDIKEGERRGEVTNEASLKKTIDDQKSKKEELVAFTKDLKSKQIDQDTDQSPAASYTNNTRLTYPAFTDLSKTVITLFTEPDEPVKIIDANLDFGVNVPLGFSTRIPMFPLVKVGFDGNIGVEMKTAGELSFSSNDLYDMFGNGNPINTSEITNKLLDFAKINLEETELDINTSLGVSLALDAYIGAILATAGVKGDFNLQPEVFDGDTKASNQKITLKDLFENSSQSNQKSPLSIETGLRSYETTIELDLNALKNDPQQDDADYLWFKFNFKDPVFYNKDTQSFDKVKSGNTIEITNSGWIRSVQSLTDSRKGSQSKTKIEINWLNDTRYREKLKDNIGTLIGSDIGLTNDSILQLLSLIDPGSVAITSQPGNIDAPKNSFSVKKDDSNETADLQTLQGAIGNFSSKEFYLANNKAIRIQFDNTATENSEKTLLLTFEVGSNFKNAYENLSVSVLYPDNPKDSITLGSLGQLTTGVVKDDMHWIASLNKENQGVDKDNNGIEFYSQSVALIANNRTQSNNEIIRDLLEGRAELKIEATGIQVNQQLGIANPWLQSGMALGYSNLINGNTLDLESPLHTDGEDGIPFSAAIWIRPYQANQVMTGWDNTVGLDDWLRRRKKEEEYEKQIELPNLTLFDSSHGITKTETKATIPETGVGQKTLDMALKTIVQNKLNDNTNINDIHFYDTKSTTDPVTGNQYLSIAYELPAPEQNASPKFGNLIIKMPTTSSLNYELIDHTVANNWTNKPYAKDILAGGNTILSLSHDIDYSFYHYEITEYSYENGTYKGSKRYFTPTNDGKSLFELTTSITSILAGNKAVTDETKRSNQELSIGYFKLDDDRFAIGLADAGRGIVFTSANLDTLTKEIIEEPRVEIRKEYLEFVDKNPFVVLDDDRNPLKNLDNAQKPQETIISLASDLKEGRDSFLENLNLFDSTYAVLNQAMIRTSSDPTGGRYPFSIPMRRDPALAWWNGMYTLDAGGFSQITTPDESFDYLQGIEFPEYTSQVSLLNGLDHSIYNLYQGKANTAIVNAGGFYFSDLDTGWTDYLNAEFVEGVDAKDVRFDDNSEIKSILQSTGQWAIDGQKVATNLSLQSIKPTKLIPTNHNTSNQGGIQFEVVQPSAVDNSIENSWQVAPSYSNLGAIQSGKNLGRSEILPSMKLTKPYNEAAYDDDKIRKYKYDDAWKQSSADTVAGVQVNGASFKNWMLREPVEIILSGGKSQEINIISTLRPNDEPGKGPVPGFDNQLTNLSYEEGDYLKADHYLMGAFSQARFPFPSPLSSASSIFIELPGHNNKEETQATQAGDLTALAYFPETLSQLTRLVALQDDKTEIIQRYPSNDTFGLGTKIPDPESIIKAIQSDDPRYTKRDQWVLAVSAQDDQRANYYGFVEPEDDKKFSLTKDLYKQEGGQPTQYLSLINGSGEIIGSSGKFESLYTVRPEEPKNLSTWNADLSAYLEAVKGSDAQSFVVPSDLSLNLNVEQAGSTLSGGSDLLVKPGERSTFILAQQASENGEKPPTGWQSSGLGENKKIFNVQLFTDNTSNQLHALYLVDSSSGLSRYWQTSKDGGLSWSSRKLLQAKTKYSDFYSPTVIGDKLYAIQYGFTAQTREEFALLEFSLKDPPELVQTYKIKSENNTPHTSKVPPVIVNENDYLSIYFVSNDNNNYILRTSYNTAVNGDTFSSGKKAYRLENQASSGALSAARLSNTTYISYPGTNENSYYITSVDTPPNKAEDIKGTAKQLNTGLLPNWSFKRGSSKPKLNSTGKELILSFNEADTRRFVGITPEKQNNNFQVRQLIDIQTESKISDNKEISVDQTLSQKKVYFMPLDSNTIFSWRETKTKGKFNINEEQNSLYESQQQIVPIPSGAFTPADTVNSNNSAWLLPRNSDDVARLTDIRLTSNIDNDTDSLYNEYYTDPAVRNNVLGEIVKKFTANDIDINKIQTPEQFNEQLQKLVSQITYKRELSINKPSPYIELATGRFFDLGLSNTKEKEIPIWDDQEGIEAESSKELKLNLKTSIDAFLRADARLLWASLNLVNLSFPLWRDERTIATGITLGGPVIANNSIWLDINSDLSLNAASEEQSIFENEWGSSWSVPDNADNVQLQNALSEDADWDRLMLYSNPQAIDAMTGLELEIAFISNLEISAQESIDTGGGSILNLFSGFTSIKPLFAPLNGNKHPENEAEIETLLQRSLLNPEQAKFLTTASSNESLYTQINNQVPGAYQSLSTQYLLHLLTIWINRALQELPEQDQLFQILLQTSTGESGNKQNTEREQATKRSLIAYNLILGYLEFIALEDHSNLPKGLREELRLSLEYEATDSFTPVKISYEKAFFEQTFKFLNTFLAYLINEQTNSQSLQNLKLLEDAQIERLSTSFFQVASDFYEKMDALRGEASNQLNLVSETELSAVGGIKKILLDPTREPSVQTLLFSQRQYGSANDELIALQSIAEFNNTNAVLDLHDSASEQQITLQPAGQLNDGQQLVLSSSQNQPLTGLAIPLILDSNYVYGEQGHYFIEGYSQRAPLFLELGAGSKHKVYTLKPGVLANQIKIGSTITLGLGQPLGQAVVSPVQGSTTLDWDGNNWISNLDAGIVDLIQILHSDKNRQELVSEHRQDELKLVSLKDSPNDAYEIKHDLMLPAGLISHEPDSVLTSPVWKFLVLNDGEGDFSIYTADKNEANKLIASSDHVLSEKAAFYVSKIEAHGLTPIYELTDPTNSNDRIYVQENALQIAPNRYSEREIAWYAQPSEAKAAILPNVEGVTQSINRDRLHISTASGSSASWIDLRDDHQHSLIIDIGELHGVLDIYGFDDKHQLILVNQSQEYSSNDVLWSGQSLLIGDDKGIRLWADTASSSAQPNLATSQPVTYLGLDAVSWIDLTSQFDIHRFWNEETASFHYISDPATISSLILQDGNNNWRYEGLAFRNINPELVGGAETATIQRFDHPGGATRFAADEDTVSDLLEAGYQVTGSIAEVLIPSANDTGDLKEVYQFINRETDQALITASPSEIRALKATPSRWLDQGVIGMVAEPALPFQTDSTALAKEDIPSVGLHELIISNGDGTNSTLQLKLDGGRLGENGISVVAPTTLVNTEIQDVLKKQGVALSQSGLDFQVDLAANSSKANLTGSVAALGGMSDLNMAYYSIGQSGQISPLTYDPVHNAGMQVFDLDGDKRADWFKLSMVDGGYGDKDGVANGEIDDPLVAAQVSLAPVINYNQNGSLKIGDPAKDAPAAILLRSRQGNNSSSVQQIGYVVLNPDEVDQAEQLFSDIEALISRASLLYSSLEDKDVVLPESFNGEQDIQLINGQNIAFFSLQQIHLNELESSSDPRFSWLRPLEQSSQLSSYRTPDGFEFSVGLEQTPATIDALIASEQSQSPVLDFSALNENQTIYGTLQMGREADFDHVTGFYTVLDGDGTVVALDGSRLKPGDAGYAAAALRTDNLFAPLTNLKVADDQVTEINFEIKGGKQLAPFSKVNGETFFAFDDANNDGINHFRSLGKNQFGLEDLYGGGDYDYDDLVMAFDFALI